MSWPDSTRGPSAHGLDPWWAFSHELDPWAFSHGLDPWAPPPWGGGNKDGEYADQVRARRIEIVSCESGKSYLCRKIFPGRTPQETGIICMSHPAFLGALSGQRLGLAVEQQESAPSLRALLFQQ
jgi:hypothetical protein